MDWLLWLNDEPECPATAEAFKAWLNGSETNRSAWKQALKTWALMGETEPQYRHIWQSPEANVVRLEPRRGRRVAIGLTALAAAIVLFLTAPALMIWLQADFRTGTAESRIITLADGSKVDLSAGSAIDVDMTDGARHVRLLAGQAFFDVAHDAGRPFTVDAGKAKVVVLGTAFDVALDETATTVQLARGIVGLSPEGNARAMTELAPGEMAIVDADTGAVSHSTVPIGEIGAWRNGQLFVNDVTIDSVVARLQRYHKAWISVPDRTLGRQRVTGLYDLHDPDRALKALVTPYGGNVRNLSAYGRILSRF